MFCNCDFFNYQNAKLFYNSYNSRSELNKSMLKLDITIAFDSFKGTLFFFNLNNKFY